MENNNDSVSLREFVTNEIRSKIIAGELQSGEKISERKISKMLGVGVMPVKEAFNQLKAEGLIVSLPRSGTYVAENSKESLLEVVYLRSVLDGMAAFFAAKYGTDEQIATLDKILKKVRTLIESRGSSDAIAAGNQEFHSFLRGMAKNGYLLNMIKNVNNVDISIRNVSGLKMRDYVELEMRQIEHEAVLRAIEERKPELAERLMVEHIRKGSGKIVMEDY